MLVPNKTFTLDETTLYKTTKLLPVLDKNLKIIDLYNLKRKEIESVSDFIDSLCLLFVIGKIDFNEKEGEVYLA